VLPNDRVFHFNSVLIAPPELKPTPESPREVPITKTEPVAPRELRPLPQPIEARVILPKLDQAPLLPNPVRTNPLLPAPEVTVRAPIQTGVFGADAPLRIESKIPTTMREAGFDNVSQSTTAAPSIAAASAGFDVRSADSRKAAVGTIQTGAFGQEEAHTARLVAANVTHTTFDARAEIEKPAAADATVRKTGFDEPKPVNAAVKPVVAEKAPAVRPVQILDKPKPAYTAEARAEKIEGTVLLDVVFAASGEVRVLGVVRGLGHGLDETAMDAARHIRFTPATQSGAPVDQRVVLHVVFQITG
jgi:TonB family protein